MLTNGALFERVKAPGNSITSPHSILGAGGVSNTWKRLRTICRPFFNQGQFEEANDRLVEHVIKSVEFAIKNSAEDGKIDLFQLVNRLVVEAHLLTILGIDSVEPAGKNIPVRDYIDSDEVTSKCMADIIDESLNVKMAEPKFSSVAFAPMMTWLTERLQLQPDQLGGIEKILSQAQKKGELLVSSMERLHNTVMYMIALAPSPATFWTIVHVYKEQKYLESIRDEAMDGQFTMIAKCVKETLRMYAPVPIMVTRYVRKNKGKSKNNCPATLLRGHDKVALQDGDRVLIPTIILHNDPFLWDNPAKYDPDRFDAPATTLSLSCGSMHSHLLRGSGIQARPKQTSSRSLNVKARYFPFGKGKHTCLGQPYASWLTLTICSTIFSHFDIEIEDVDGLLEKRCSYERIKDHVYTFPKGTFKANVTILNDKLRDSTISGKNFRDSMMFHMHDFSEFLQGGDDDDESDDDDDDDVPIATEFKRNQTSTSARPSIVMKSSQNKKENVSFSSTTRKGLDKATFVRFHADTTPLMEEDEVEQEDDESKKEGSKEDGKEDELEEW